MIPRASWIPKVVLLPEKLCVFPPDLLQNAISEYGTTPATSHQRSTGPLTNFVTRAGQRWARSKAQSSPLWLRGTRRISTDFPGYLTVRHGKSPFLIGKSSINGPFSMAMLNNQRVLGKVLHPRCHWSDFPGLTSLVAQAEVAASYSDSEGRGTNNSQMHQALGREISYDTFFLRHSIVYNTELTYTWSSFYY